jgi:hypothetical protein
MGVYTLARGKGSYEGEWRNGKAHGVGKFTGPTGEEVRKDFPSSNEFPWIAFDFSQVEGIWDNGTLKPSVSAAGIGAAEAASAVEADDLYDDSFDDDAGGSGNGSDEDRLSEGEVISERDADRQNAAQESEYQAPPASALPLYDVTSSQFVVHVQQQSSNVGAIGKIQGPVRPVKVKKTTVPSFIGLKLRLKVVKMLAVFLRFLF